MRYKGAYSEHEEPQILIHTVHRHDDIPDNVKRIFSGDTGADLGLRASRPDGLGNFPECYRQFALKLHSHMDEMATNLFNVIRWHRGIMGGPLVLQSEWSSMRWHDPTKGEQILDVHGFLNRQMPAGVFLLELPEMQFASLNRERCEAVEELFRSKARQPLYHDLLREACQNKKTNSRSALVMGIAAAETGFKITATDLNPSTSWILENLPSPPLDRMIREYLEQLPARRTFDGKVRRPPNTMISTLKKGIELRNKLVHGREENVDPKQLNEILIAVRDLLYLLDFYRGHDWALDRLTPEVAEEMRKGT